jgi:hypothetical protein
LIPADTPERDKTNKNLRSIKVFVAAEIFQRHELKSRETHVSGSGIGEVSLQTTPQGLELYMTEECIESDSPSFELIEQLATHCGVEHPALLYTALADDNLDRIRAAYLREGFHVSLNNKSECKSAFVSILPSFGQRDTKLTNPCRSLVETREAEDQIRR